MASSTGDGIADAATARALANPLRQRILRELRRSGPATSTTLAARLGVTTGGTSYNLRVLAEHGFVQEVPERARGRERWWRETPRDLLFPRRSEQDAELAAAVDELNQLWLSEDLRSFTRFQQHRAQLGEWADALPYSRGTIRVTLDQLGQFFTDYLALLRRYQHPDGDLPPGARTVLARFVAFPEIEENAVD
jgi:DNA-binding MarR family transcriptional regulator